MVSSPQSANDNLRGRAALITGSLGGIGFEIAMALARRGCSVVLNGIGDTSAAATQVQQLREAGGQAHFHLADVACGTQLERLVANAQDCFGHVDILVNNAVARFNAKIEDLPVDKWQQALAVNLTAPFLLTRLLLPGMKQRNWGRVINLSSVLGLTGTPGRSDYVVTKHGIAGLTKVVALECADTNVTCNALCPGAVETPHIKQLIENRATATGQSVEAYTREFLDARQPTRRFIPPSRVGALAAFLCTEEAGDITGAMLPIDGGWLARG